MDEKELKEKAEIILRNHLLRCFDDVAKEFPGLTDMPQQEAIEHLLTLRRERKIKITLNTIANSVKTRIDWIS